MVAHGNYLIYISETALYNDIMTTSLWVDIILEVAEYLVMWLWNFTKQKVSEYKINKMS